MAKDKERPYDCELCLTPCADHRSFLRHQRESCLFSNPELFKCQICPNLKTFKRQSDLARHVRFQHEQGKTTCSICGKKSRPDAHATHLRTKHGLETIDLSQDDADRIQIQEEVPVQDYLAVSATSYAINSLEDPLKLPVQNINARIASTALLTQYKQCGLCSEEIDVNRPEHIRKHINDHMEECSQKHWCNDCDVYFLFLDDLNFHLASASHGNCGYAFGNHECKGHHPNIFPTENEPVRQDKKRQQRRPRRNHDEFVWRVRQWEKKRIEHHGRCLKELMECLLPRQCRTSPHAGSVPAKSAASWRTVPAKVNYDAKAQASIEEASTSFEALSLQPALPKWEDRSVL